MHIPVPVFIAVLALSSAVLAVWVHVRFPRLAPSNLRVAVIHIVASLLAMQVMTVPAGAMLDPDAPQRALVAIFAIVLPALVYSFLAGLWMMKVCQRMLGGALR